METWLISKLRLPLVRRFNSATALRPWKLCSKGDWLSAASCFNSATALRPWKQDFRRSVWVNQLALQFGHGIEAVETATIGVGLSYSEMLQFGHGIEAVETVRMVDDGGLMRTASIRPRH